MMKKERKHKLLLATSKKDKSTLDALVTHVGSPLMVMVKLLILTRTPNASPTLYKFFPSSPRAAWSSSLDLALKDEEN